jgi:hypothetical protein
MKLNWLEVKYHVKGYSDIVIILFSAEMWSIEKHLFLNDPPIHSAQLKPIQPIDCGTMIHIS